MAACGNTFISPYPFVVFMNVLIIVPKTLSLWFFLIMVMLYPARMMPDPTFQKRNNVCIHQENGNQSKIPQPFTVCGGVPKFWFQNIQLEVQTPRSKSTRWPFVTNSAPHRAPQKGFWHKEPNYIPSMGRESSGTQNADLAPEGYGWPGVSVHIAVSLDSKTCGPFCLSCRLSQQLVFKGCGTV